MIPQMYTPVAVPTMDFRLDFDSGVVSVGSCFADEIGSRLAGSGFAVEQNPFGTLYNPASVAAALERLVDCREIGDDDLVLHEGLYHSWHHHGSFSRPDKDETVGVCNARIHKAHCALREARLLMVTFGTAWVYELESGMVVANFHKLPAGMFSRRRMTKGEIVSLWRPLLQKIKTFNPNLTVLFTVSPIRHLADGAHGNQLSKATLLLAVDELDANYFPAYEIVLDELRDYRFYGPDMTHPSPLAVEVVWDRFCEAFMAPNVRQQAHNNMKQQKRKQHIPLH